MDEIELHLHPTLAQEVLERFHKTFPLIQFIVSTHSPLVISNLKQSNSENKVIKLINEGLEFKNEPVENIYGVDYITTLVVMDTKYRISTIDKLIDAYVSLKTRNKEIEAKSVRLKLDEIVGFNNRLIEEEINKKIKANQ
jgi:predicted ATP-binding protein involved in virulence